MCDGTKVVLLGKKKTKENKKEKATVKHKKELFNAILVSPKKLTSVLDVSASFLSDVVIKVNENGMTISAVDPQRVSMVFIDMPSGFFSKFRSNTNFSWGVDIADLKKIMGRAKGNEAIEIAYNGDEPSILSIHIIKGKKRRTFKIRNKSVKIDVNDPAEDEIVKFANNVEEEFKVKLKMDLDVLKRIAEDARLIGETVHFEYEPDEPSLVKVYSVDPVSGSVETTLNISDEEDVKGSSFADGTPQYAHGCYGLEYIDTFLNMAGTVEVPWMTIGEDLPLILRGDFKKEKGRLETVDGGSIIYLVAPRFEEDEDDLYDEEGNLKDIEINDAVEENRNAKPVEEEEDTIDPDDIEFSEG